MLQHTFCHIPTIGPQTERRIWAKGRLRWQDWLDCPDPSFPIYRQEQISEALLLSQARFHQRDLRHFLTLLPAREHWRIFGEFHQEAAYLDIETNGYPASNEAITCISLYDGHHISTYVQGVNLDQFVEDIQRITLLITYNGKCFDIPFIEKSLHIALPCAHIDLRYILANLGYKGGLKGCERQIGISRDTLDGVDGLFAVILWYDYLQNPSTRTLDTLLAYNVADTIHLEQLMIHAYNKKVEQTPFSESLRISPHPPPPNPYCADPATLQRLLPLYRYRQQQFSS